MFAFLRTALCAFLGLLVNTGVSFAAAPQDENDKQILRVGCEGGFAPFTYIDDKNQLTGFDIDLIRVMGRKMGYAEVQITVYPFDGLIPTLMTDNIDLIISGFTISEERAKHVDFSDPYYRCSLTYLVKKENAEKFSKFESLRDTEVCTQLGTTGAMYLEKALPGVRMKRFNSPAESYIELQNEGCQAVLNDRPVNDFYITASGSKNLASIEVPEADHEFYGIAVRKGNHKLLAAVNAGLKAVRDDGSFAEISKKWFGYDVFSQL